MMRPKVVICTAFIYQPLPARDHCAAMGKSKVVRHGSNRPIFFQHHQPRLVRTQECGESTFDMVPRSHFLAEFPIPLEWDISVHPSIDSICKC